MRKKALVVYRVDKSIPENIGVVNKLLGQVDGLSFHGYDVDYICIDQDSISLNSSRCLKHVNRKNSIKFKWSFYNYISADDFKVYDLYLCRYGLTTTSFLSWVRHIKALQSSATILIDMPTYPYKKEWTSIGGKVIMKIDQVLCRFLKHHVDYILHSGSEKMIFNIPTIKCTNGIQIDKIKVRKPKSHHGTKLLAIGKWQYWHGLDRLLFGLKGVVDQGGRDITLDIVGEGPGLDELTQIVKKLDIIDRVNFKGVCSGHELDMLFDMADIGVGTLGLHRKGVYYDSSLKHREYVARGLPFFLSSSDTDIGFDNEFVLKVPEDESHIELDELIQYFERLNTSDILLKMRKFAEDHLSWRNKMYDILRQLQATS